MLKKKFSLLWSIEYFNLKLLTLAFEKQYINFEVNEKSSPYSNNTNKTNNTNFFEVYYFLNETNNGGNNYDNTQNIIKTEDLYTLLTFIGTFILFFYFTLSVEPVIYSLSGQKDQKK